MACWEYKTETQSGWGFSQSTEDLILSQSGRDGWELVQIRDANNDSQGVVIYTFKRKAS